MRAGLPQPQQFEPGDQEQGDLLLLASLERDGVDLARTADVACFLELPELQSARAAARDLRNDGWAADVAIAPDELTWTVRACRPLVPSWQNIVDMGSTMNDVALRHGGAYDGWGIRAVR